MIQNNLFSDTPDKLEVFENKVHYVVWEAKGDGDMENPPGIYTNPDFVTRDSLLDDLRDQYSGASDELIGIIPIDYPPHDTGITMFVFKLDKHPLLFTDTALADLWVRMENQIDKQGWLESELTEELWEMLDTEYGDYDYHDYDMIMTHSFKELDRGDQENILYKLDMSEEELDFDFDIKLNEEEYKPVMYIKSDF